MLSTLLEIYALNSMSWVGNCDELLTGWFFCLCFGCQNSTTGEMDLQLLEAIELTSFGLWRTSVNLS